MYFELPLPVITKDGKFTACEVRKPPGGVLADVVKVMKTKGVAHAMLEFIKGVLVNLENEDGILYQERSKFESVARQMPVRSAEVICIKVLSLMNPKDFVQGIYVCPGCRKEIKVSEKNGNSINYADLKIEKVENEPLTFSILEPVEIKGESGDIKASMQSVTLYRPTMNNYITGQMRFPPDDVARREYAMLVDAIMQIDGEQKELSWIRTWGVQLFDRMGYDDLKKILEETKTGGIQREIEIYCPNCGETFSGDIDPSSFFVSGLQ